MLLFAAAYEVVVQESGDRLPDKTMLTVHLDFKGAPPNLQYLKTLLPKMARAGCDSLLIEYEDMFPYKGKLANLSATNHYSSGQVREPGKVIKLFNLNVGVIIK